MLKRYGNIALHCIALHCIALHCIALHCIALKCISCRRVVSCFLDSDEWKRGLDFGHLGASGRASLLASVLISDFCFGDGLKEDRSETATRVAWIMVHGPWLASSSTEWSKLVARDDR